MHCWARYLLWLAVAVLGTGSLLSACGHKGELYLPAPQQQGPEQPHQSL